MNETLTNQIGEQLKAARLEKQLSLDDIQEITKIQRRYLLAIEENNLSVLPGDFYVRAFIRQYALAVGLHPDELLGETKPISMSRTSDLSRAHRDNDGIVRAGIDNTPTARSRLANSIPTIGLGLLILVALIVIWFVLTHIGTNSQQTSNGGNISVSTSEVSKSSSKSSASKSSASSSSEESSKLDLGTPETDTSLQTTIYNLSNENTKKHTVVITAKNTGTSVKVNDASSNILLNETLASGSKTVEIPAGTTAFNLQFSNVNNASVTVDGQDVEISGATTSFWNVLFNLNK
ncbi:helix-turn-helix domain-containing protein [Leuconostoc suionicum]|uniref:Helix-turn-helix domain protein n=1 Tax=Leuconostoc suionicum TaxID=1511761 RepID=A0A2N9KA38_9LACO|nr:MULTISPECIES: RodZ domain-containing protein [Leuconostoc]API71661.1 XRE family transcriptional regulator [Leuconostoc suionicum]MBE4727166.1 helix-turn-helix domain-containing protein [Leuconostoc suionicum]MCT4402407.1 XRE family transcriptional regulator [Leuconostoc suionicum]MDI6497222.1 helix-turn-helix domain-containing protein [Leuconostoc suionicum]MDI6499304.1 helix-turn-helix domain-containing protein [Leuconostoc suionicum]